MQNINISYVIIEKKNDGDNL